MINLIKAEFYRIKPFLWVILAVIAGSIMPVSNWLNAIQTDPNSLVTNSWGILTFTQEDGILIVEQFIYTINQLAVLYSAVISYIAVNSEFTKRTMINTSSYRYTRWEIYLSKLIFGFLLGLGFLLVAIVSLTIVNLILAPLPIDKYLELFWETVFKNGLSVFIMQLAIFTSVFFIRDKFTSFLIFTFIFEIGQALFISFLQFIKLTSLADFIKVWSPVNLSITPQTGSTPAIAGVDVTVYLALVYAGIAIFIGYQLFKNKEIK